MPEENLDDPSRNHQLIFSSINCLPRGRLSLISLHESVIVCNMGMARMTSPSCTSRLVPRDGFKSAMSLGIQQSHAAAPSRHASARSLQATDKESLRHFVTILNRLKLTESKDTIALSLSTGYRGSFSPPPSYGVTYDGSVTTSTEYVIKDSSCPHLASSRIRIYLQPT